MLKQHHNAFLITRTVVNNLLNADWGNNPIAETFRSITGLNTWPFFVEDNGDWTKKRIESLLSPKGVKMWSWGYSQGEYMFLVKKKQARWAQYVLLQAGVPLKGRLL